VYLRICLIDEAQLAIEAPVLGADKARDNPGYLKWESMGNAGKKYASSVQKDPILANYSR